MDSPQVLIVDDDPSVRSLLAQVVKCEGGSPITAASGVEGYAALENARTDIALVLLDLSMPEMDGFKFRALQLEDSELSTIPIVVLTGYQLTSSELAFMRAAAVLRKPAPIAEIRSAIRRCAAVTTART
jgi:CheY-like chemotaxis protein